MKRKSDLHPDLVTTIAKHTPLKARTMAYIGLANTNGARAIKRGPNVDITQHILLPRSNRISHEHPNIGKVEWIERIPYHPVDSVRLEHTRQTRALRSRATDRVRPRYYSSKLAEIFNALSMTSLGREQVMPWSLRTSGHFDRSSSRTAQQLRESRTNLLFRSCHKICGFHHRPCHPIPTALCLLERFDILHLGQFKVAAADCEEWNQGYGRVRQPRYVG